MDEFPRAVQQRRALEATAIHLGGAAAALGEASNASPDTILIAVTRLKAEAEVCAILCSAIARQEGLGGI